MIYLYRLSILDESYRKYNEQLQKYFKHFQLFSWYSQTDWQQNVIKLNYKSLL